MRRPGCYGNGHYWIWRTGAALHKKREPADGGGVGETDTAPQGTRGVLPLLGGPLLSVPRHLEGLLSPPAFLLLMQFGHPSPPPDLSW